MIFSGAQGFKKRSISDQIDTFGYNLTINVDNTIGSCQVGFSGNNSLAAFTFAGGKIIDPAGNFVRGYDANTDIHINGIIRQNSYDYFIDNQPVALGYPWHTGTYSWFFVNPQNSNANVNVNVSGISPTYDFSPSGFYTQSGASVSTYIINQTPEKRFRIFGAEINERASPYFVQSFETGYIVNSGHVTLSSYNATNNNLTVPLILHTNFGKVDFNFYVGGNNIISTPNPRDVYLNISPLPDVIISKQNFLPYTLSFSNYPSGVELDVSLQYASGVTGFVYQKILTTNFVTNEFVSGYVTGSQSLSKFISHSVTGYDAIGQVARVNPSGSGVMYSDVLYASGPVSLDYNTKVFGKGEGFALKNEMMTGQTQAQISGLVPYRGLFINTSVSNVPGTGQDGLTGIIANGTGGAFLYPTGQAVIHFDLSQYHSAFLVKDQCYVGPVSFNYDLPCVGYAMGGSATGLINASFLQTVDPGNYHIYAQNDYAVATLISGLIPFSVFDPVVCSTTTTPNVSGIISGRVDFTGYYDCSNFPFKILVSGAPTEIYHDGDLIPNEGVYQVIPQEGFLATEKSIFKASGGVTRTSISETNPARGFFDEIVGNCDFLGGWGQKLDFGSIRYSGILTVRELCGTPDSSPNYIGASFFVSGYSEGGPQTNYPSGNLQTGHWKDLYGYVDVVTGYQSGTVQISNRTKLLGYNNQLGSGVTSTTRVTQAAIYGVRSETYHSGLLPIVTSGYLQALVPSGIAIERKHSINESTSDWIGDEIVTLTINYSGQPLKNLRLAVADVHSGLQVYNSTYSVKRTIYPNIIFGYAPVEQPYYSGIFQDSPISGYPILNCPQMDERIFTGTSSGEALITGLNAITFSVQKFLGVGMDQLQDFEVSYDAPILSGIQIPLTQQAYEMTGRVFVPYSSGNVDSGVVKFKIGGTGLTKKIALRALSPSLEGFSNPDLILLRNGDFYAYNNDYLADSYSKSVFFNNSSELLNDGFVFPSTYESAMILDLPPGDYTAITRSLVGNPSELISGGSCAQNPYASYYDAAYSSSNLNLKFEFDESSLCDMIFQMRKTTNRKIKIGWCAPKIRNLLGIGNTLPALFESDALNYGQECSASIENPLRSNLKIFAIDANCNHSLLLNTAGMQDEDLSLQMGTLAIAQSGVADTDGIITNILGINPINKLGTATRFINGPHPIYGATPDILKGKTNATVEGSYFMNMCALERYNFATGALTSGFYLAPNSAMQVLYPDPQLISSGLNNYCYSNAIDFSFAYASGHLGYYNFDLWNQFTYQGLLGNLSGSAYSGTHTDTVSWFGDKADYLNAIKGSARGFGDNRIPFLSSKLADYPPSTNVLSSPYVNGGFFSQRRINFTLTLPDNCQRIRVIVETRRSNNFAVLNQSIIGAGHSIIKSGMLDANNLLGATQSSLGAYNYYPRGFPIYDGYNPISGGDVHYTNHVWHNENNINTQSNGANIPFLVAKETNYSQYPSSLPTDGYFPTTVLGVPMQSAISTSGATVTDLRPYIKNTLRLSF